MKVFWRPQPGPQTAAATCPCDLIFFGGTRGGGKSDCLLGRHLLGAQRYGKAWNGLIIRRKFKDFGELRRRIDELISQGLPAERTGGDHQTNFIRFRNGALVTMTAVTHLEMVDSFQGQQYTEISIDEAQNFPFLYQMIDKLKACLRSPHGVPCHMFLTGNPGGPGSNIIKMMFVEAAPYGKVTYDKDGESKVFIFSKLEDNKILCEKDPKYVNRLRAIKDPALRRAWLEGDWDVFVGQAFNFSYEHHVIKPLPIPRGAPLYSTFDWGFGAPFAWQWWWVDGDGRIYLFAEWYGCGEAPNTGLRLTDSEIAQGVIEREKKMGIWGREIIRLAGPDCFNKKPDYKGGGQGPSTAEIFAEHGIYLTAGDPNRKLKIRQFRERLRILDDAPPMLLVYENCRHFIRTIPALCVSEDDPEDIEGGQEDHCYDAACLICMAHPIAMVTPEEEKSYHDRRIEMLEKGHEREDDYEGYATVEQRLAIKDLGIDEWFFDNEEEEYAPDLVRTIRER